MDRPTGTECSPVSVPLERTGGPSARRARLILASWALGLAGVTALGLSGHEARSEAAILPNAGTALPLPTLAATIPVPAIQRIARPSVTRYRSLGDDGLAGGIVFGDNVPGAYGPG